MNPTTGNRENEASTEKQNNRTSLTDITTIGDFRIKLLCGARTYYGGTRLEVCTCGRVPKRCDVRLE